MRSLVLPLIALLTTTLACGDSEPKPPPGAAPPTTVASAPAPAPADAGAALAEAQNVFATRCTTCHGPQGAGDGPGSAALDPKPRNFQDPAWQASVTDEHLEKIVLYGGAAVGRSPTMPGNPDLMAKPEVVAGLVAHVRSLKK